MKKALTFLLLFALLLGISACVSPKETDVSGNPTPDETIKPTAAFSEDFDNRFGRGYESIVETDEAYYYCAFRGKYLY